MIDFIKEVLSKLDMIKSGASATVMIALLMIVYALIYKAIPDANKEALIHVLGIIEGGLIAIISFYFGSSKKQQ